MSEALVIRFPPMPQASNVGDAPTVQWMLVDTIGNRMGAVLEGSLQEASGLAAGRRVLALVGGTEVLHTEPVLPPLKGGAKLAQIVPFALEDQLATDVDELHFAIGKRAGRPGTPIAIVAHRQLQQWLRELQEVGLHPAALYTDTSIVPTHSDGVMILIDQGRVTLRRGTETPASLDVAPLSEALQLLLPITTSLPATVYVSESEYDREQASIEALRERVASLQIKLLPDGVLPLLAVQALKSEGLNLLQGVYEPKRNLTNEFKPWRYASVLIAVLCGLQLVVTGTRWGQLKHRETLLDQQIASTFAQGMPGTTPVSSTQARRAFESRLMALQAGGVNSQLLQSMSALADAIAKTPDSQISALSYHDNIVDLKVTAANVEALDQVRKLAAVHGMSAEIQSANPRDGKIEGRLQLKPLSVTKS